MRGISCHVLHLWLGFFELLRCCPLSHSTSAAPSDGAVETYVGWDVQSTQTFSHLLPFAKSSPKQSTMKRKINTGKPDLQLIREMEQGLTPKPSFLLVKQQPIPRWGGIHTIYLECLHKMAPRHFVYSFCINWTFGKQGQGRFLLMTRTYSRGVWLKFEVRNVCSWRSTVEMEMSVPCWNPICNVSTSEVID